MKLRRSYFAQLFLVSLIAGCSHDLPVPDRPKVRESALRPTTAPVATGRSIYPLQLGNRWIYHGWGQRIAFGPSGDTLRSEGTWTEVDSLSRVETIAGTAYFRKDIWIQEDSTRTKFVNWLREDGSGLYGLRNSQVLSYPLHTGAQWLPSEDPYLVAEVAGRDRIDLPQGSVQAWRIKFSHPFDSPSSPSHFDWYGSGGYIGSVYHSHQSKGGYQIISDEKLWLVSADLGGSSWY